MTTLFALATLLAMTNLPAPQAEPFPLSDVKLLGGPFLHANQVCVDYLLKVEPDRLLHNFREHSGLKAKGEIYQGWENSGLAGHSLGHYLTACAQEYAATKDKRFKDKIDAIVAELQECQKSRPDGYISAIPDGDKHWAEIKKGDIRSGGFDLNGMWSPWYTHHKVLAGLLDANRLAGNKAALGVAEKFADWMIEETKPLTDEQWQKMLVCEYGGMNDSLAELYNETKQTKYLDLARKFYDKRILDPLSKGEDDLSGKHSNTQIPKIIGLARLYELTGTTQDAKTAEFFWDRVVHHHTYAIGGNSNHEYLGPPDQLSDRLSSNTCETCNTYNMLKLTRHLFEWEPKAEYADYYERAHLNHILASQDPQNGMMTYFMPLASGAHRDYSTPWDNWTCCHGSGMENHTKHADSIYFRSPSLQRRERAGERGSLRETLWVNLFIPSEVTWQGLKIKQDTAFPNDGKVTLTVESGGTKRFVLAVRHPGWAKESVKVNVNGNEVARSEKPSSYIEVDRTWTKGDKVEIVLPMSLHTEAMPDNPKRMALLYGPVVLAADLAPRESEVPRIPVLVAGEKPVKDWLKKGEGLQFRTEGVGRPADLTFKPFYAITHNRYAVYFDQFTDAQWKQAEAEYRAEETRLKDLEARTVDYVRIGEMQPERDHNLKSEKNDVREANGRGFRTPLNGGWFELDAKVDPAKENELVITYWGNERQRPEFEILVDGKKVADETLADRPANKFYDVIYPIAKDLTNGKEKVVVRVQAKERKSAGSVSGMRIVKKG